MKKMLIFTSLLLLGIGNLITSTSSFAAIITFNGTAGEGVCAPASQNGGGSYSEAGYDLNLGTNAFDMFFCDNDAFPGLSTFDDDVLEFDDRTNAFFSVTKSDGSLFDFTSIDLGSLGRTNIFDPSDPGTLADIGSLVFTGVTNSGIVVRQIDDIFDPVTATFGSPFINLTSLTVAGADGFFPVVDNIVLQNSVVPEPSIIALFAAGLFGLGFARRRTHN